MWRKFWVCSLSVGLLLNPLRALHSQADPVNTYTTEQGIAFDYPVLWALEAGGAPLVLSNDRRVVENAVLGEDDVLVSLAFDTFDRINATASQPIGNVGAYVDYWLATAFGASVTDQARLQVGRRDTILLEIERLDSVGRLYYFELHTTTDRYLVRLAAEALDSATHKHYRADIEAMIASFRAVGLATYTLRDQGITLDYPADWALDHQGATDVLVSATPRLLQELSPQGDDLLVGLAFNLPGATTADWGQDIADAASAAAALITVFPKEFGWEFRSSETITRNGTLIYTSTWLWLGVAVRLYIFDFETATQSYIVVGAAYAADEAVLDDNRAVTELIITSLAVDE